MYRSNRSSAAGLFVLLLRFSLNSGDGSAPNVNSNNINIDKIHNFKTVEQHKRSIQLGRFGGFNAEKLTQRLEWHSQTNERKLQDKTFCESFDEDAFGDDIFQTVGCACTETSNSFTLTCSTNDICIIHTGGNRTFYTGDFSYVVTGDYSQNRNKPVFHNQWCHE